MEGIRINTVIMGNLILKVGLLNKATWWSLLANMLEPSCRGRNMGRECTLITIIYGMKVGISKA